MPFVCDHLRQLGGRVLHFGALALELVVLFFVEVTVGPADLLLKVVTLAHIIQVFLLQTLLHFLQLPDRRLVPFHLV